MADRFDTWESYFYPETITGPNGFGTLRNKFDERDYFELKDREYERTHRRAAELVAGMVDIPKTFNAEHLKAIHRHLFHDVYEWAGEYRTVNMSKGPGRIRSRRRRIGPRSAVATSSPPARRCSRT